MRLAPSILSADFSRLGEQISQVERAGARQLHLDVMDGHYVDNLTFGPLIVQAIRRSTELPLDVHLQMENAHRWIERFSDSGADMIAVHPETIHDLLHPTLRTIRALGKKAGVALHPSKPVAMLEKLLPDVDYVIVMSVYPGFAGQRFIPGSFERVQQLREWIQEHRLAVEIEIDGGIGRDNIRQAVEAGADVVVAGSAVFAGADPAGSLRAMLAAVDNGA
jgi:ribulose-phosphate 3-epimerase